MKYPCECFHFIIVSSCEAPATSNVVFFVTVVGRWYSTNIVAEGSTLNVAQVQD